MDKLITVIDYGLGNLASVGNALKKLGIPYRISSDAEFIKQANAIILPGVGAAGKGMENLRKNGLDIVIKELAEKGVPILGICLGMQLMLSESEEGEVKCLDLVKGKVKRFKIKLKVPEIGWNEIKVKSQKSKVKSFLRNIPNKSYFYFVNSYFCEPEDEAVVAGVTDYDGEFCSVIAKDNLYGVQFHPEKSGEVGLQMLKNFNTLSSRPKR